MKTRQIAYAKKEEQEKEPLLSQEKKAPAAFAPIVKDKESESTFPFLTAALVVFAVVYYFFGGSNKGNEL